jgi:hypothetical protein
MHSQAHSRLLVSFASPGNSGVNLYFAPPGSENAERLYISPAASPAALPEPSSDAALVIAWELKEPGDRESVMLSRHLQATASSSSVRWISAFSIGAYRNFVEKFFANDTAAIDGDGRHFLASNRALLDAAGVTHLMQLLPPGSTDTMDTLNVNLIASHPLGNRDVRLYENPTAYPKAFVVRDAWETPAVVPEPLAGASARITRYQATRIDIDVATPQAAHLILADSWTPQWHASINNEPVPVEPAAGVFRSVAIPAGEHQVTLRYYSIAAARAKVLTLAAAGVVIVLILWPPNKPRSL